VRHKVGDLDECARMSRKCGRRSVCISFSMVLIDFSGVLIVYSEEKLFPTKRVRDHAGSLVGSSV
jgi:hypothetical protein